MDDFKILFYIAVALGWYLLKNYNKVKQNRPVIKKDDNPNNPKNVIIEKMPGTFSNEKLKEKIKQTRQVIKKEYKEYTKERDLNTLTIKEEKRKTASVAPFLTADMPKEKSVSIINTEKNNEIAELNKIFFEEGVFVIKNFDIRSAIIYSEILKRPEY